ncbi:hypothetical protein R1flu_012721 [Riccia fluitans]|uniref:Uncharacterized protein n=1 Tax=Riccia fluitans TaxID=41844 RepID=A0ABD1ZBF1_9MARC
MFRMVQARKRVLSTKELKEQCPHWELRRKDKVQFRGTARWKESESETRGGGWIHFLGNGLRALVTAADWNAWVDGVEKDPHKT